MERDKGKRTGRGGRGVLPIHPHQTHPSLTFPPPSPAHPHPPLLAPQVCGSWLHMIDTYLWPASNFNVTALPDPVPGGHYITAVPGTGGPDTTPIPAAADLFNAGAAATMPVPFAAAKRRRTVAAAVGTAAAAVAVAACGFAGFACTRAWRRSRDAAERAGCERGLAMGMSNATGNSSEHFDAAWPDCDKKSGGGANGLGGGPHGSGGGPGGGSGGGVALSGALAALAAARGAEGPTTAEEGEFLTGDTLAAALSAHRRGSGGGPGTGGRPLPSSSGAATIGGVPSSGGGGANGGRTAAAFGPTPALPADRDAPAPDDDWSACLAAELGPSGWAIDGGSVRILTTPDGRPRRLGEGGFGAVYLAEMDGSTQVAVKLLSTQQPREGEGRGEGAREREPEGRSRAEANPPLARERSACLALDPPRARLRSHHTKKNNTSLPFQFSPPVHRRGRHSERPASHEHRPIPWRVLRRGRPGRARVRVLNPRRPLSFARPRLQSHVRLVGAGPGDRPGRCPGRFIHAFAYSPDCAFRHKISEHFTG